MGALLGDFNGRPRAGGETQEYVGIANGILMYTHKIDVGRIIVKSQTAEYWGHFQVAVGFWLGEPTVFSHVTVD